MARTSSVRSQSWQRFLAEVFRRLRIRTLPHCGDQSLVSFRLFVAALLSFLFFWHRLSSLSEVHCGSTRVTPCLTGSSIFWLHLQPWRKGALLWLHVAVFFFEFSGSYIFPKNPRVVRTLQAEESGWRTSQLECPKVGQAEDTGWKPSQLTCQRVGHTRQAEEPGSRCSHLHQVGEEFLNSEVASEVPALLSTRRIGGTSGIRGCITPRSGVFGNPFKVAVH